MTTFLFTMVLLVTGPSVSNLATNKDVTTNSDYSKVKVIVTEKNVPLAGVFVKVTQGNMHLGETITDENGQAIILCKHLSDENHEVQINATKIGYQPVHIHGNLITSLTDFKFNLTKEGEKAPQTNDMNFQFEVESLNVALD